MDRVFVEFCSRIEPKVYSLFFITLPMDVDIGLDRVRLPAPVSQELKVQLVSDTVGVGIHLPPNLKQIRGNPAI